MYTKYGVVLHDWESLVTAKNYFNEPRERNISPMKYRHVMLKCSDDWFAMDP